MASRASKANAADPSAINNIPRIIMRSIIQTENFDIGPMSRQIMSVSPMITDAANNVFGKFFTILTPFQVFGFELVQN